MGPEVSQPLTYLCLRLLSWEQGNEGLFVVTFDLKIGGYGIDIALMPKTIGNMCQGDENASVGGKRNGVSHLHIALCFVNEAHR